MPKGIPNKRYTPEFKKQVVEAVLQDGLMSNLRQQSGQKQSQLSSNDQLVERG